MENSTEKRVRRSTAPIYLVGVVWLVLAALSSHSMGIGDALLAAALSAAAFVAGKAIFPDKSYTVPTGQAAGETGKKEEKKPEPPKDPEVQKLLQERERALSEMRRLNDSIKDEKISAQIDHLEEVTGKIIDQVVAQPKKRPQIRRFLDYYLPTTLKLLNAYDRMAAAGVDGENISVTKEKIEDMMDTIVKAFDKQLDALFGEEALDVSTDITVMENLLAREGLAGGQIGGEGGGIKLEL